MELGELKAFVTVAAEHSFSRADGGGIASLVVTPMSMVPAPTSPSVSRSATRRNSVLREETTVLTRVTRLSGLIPAAILFGSHALYAQQACENLVNLKLPYTLITAATTVPEAAAPASAAPGAPPGAPGAVPAHCDGRGFIRPSSDSDIKFALWLPTASAWNGKYRQEGNGGWAGTNNTSSLLAALSRGCAAPSSATGH